jgi:hypothetical protein
MLAIRAYLLVDYRVNAEATPDSFPPAHGTRPTEVAGGDHLDRTTERKTASCIINARKEEL